MPSPESDSSAVGTRPSDQPITIGQFGTVVAQNWILIVVLAVLGAAGGYAAAKIIPPTYTATATQLVNGVPGTGAAANYEAAQFAVSRAKSYPSFINSGQVLDGVRADLGGKLTVVELRQQLSADNPADTPLLQITAEGDSPEQARDMANSAARHMARFITQIETVGGKSPILVETAVQASLPIEPTSPRPLLLTALGLAMGLAISVGVALLRTYIGSARRAARAAKARKMAEAAESGKVERVPVWQSDDAPDFTPAEPTAENESARVPNDDRTASAKGPTEESKPPADEVAEAPGDRATAAARASDSS